MIINKILLTMVAACLFGSAVYAEYSTFGFESQEENLNESTFGFESQLPVSEEEQEILRLKQQNTFENVKEKMLKKDYGKFLENEKLQQKTKMVYTLRQLLKENNLSSERRAKLTALLKKYEKEEQNASRDYNRFLRNTDKELAQNRKERQKKLDQIIDEIQSNAQKDFPAGDKKNRKQDSFFELQGSRGSLNGTDILRNGGDYVKPNPLQPKIQYVRYEHEGNRPALTISYPRNEITSDGTRREFVLADYNYRTLNDAQQDLSEGVILPNRPVYVSPEKKAQMKKVIRAFFNHGGIAKMKAYEREAFNAMIFNYGLQLLETGEVVELELIDDYTGGKPMLTPDIPMPDSAKQVNIGGYDKKEKTMEIY